MSSKSPIGATWRVMYLSMENGKLHVRDFSSLNEKIKFTRRCEDDSKQYITFGWREDKWTLYEAAALNGERVAAVFNAIDRKLPIMYDVRRCIGCKDVIPWGPLIHSECTIALAC